MSNVLSVVPHPLRDFRDPIAGCHYSVGGFTFLKNDLVMIIEGHPVTESGKKVGAVCSEKNVQMLGLKTIEDIARGYVGNKSDSQIFNGSPEAVAEQTTQGYVCNEILRRLARIQQKDAETVDYTRLLDIKAMTELITQALADKDSPMRKPEHRDIPLAQNYILQRYGLWSTPATEEPKLAMAS